MDTPLPIADQATVAIADQAKDSGEEDHMLRPSRRRGPPAQAKAAPRQAGGKRPRVSQVATWQSLLVNVGSVAEPLQQGGEGEGHVVVSDGSLPLPLPAPAAVDEGAGQSSSAGTPGPPARIFC